MTNNTPIILDRLGAALAAQGVQLKRNQLLEVAAAAYGYRNANAFSAAAKTDDLKAPRPESLGLDDRGLHILRDPATGDVFGIDPRSPSNRAQQWCLSPYGGIVDMAGITPESRVEIKIHAASISHKHGTDFYVSATKAGLDAQIAGFCEEWWGDARAFDEELPETTEGMSDEEIISTYFEVVDDEYVEVGEDVIKVAPAVAATISTPTGEAWVITRVDLESDDPILWWNGEDGWVDLESADVYPDRSGTLPTAGMDEASVSWQRLPIEMVRTTGETPEEPTHWDEAEMTAAETAVARLVHSNGIQAADQITFRSVAVAEALVAGVRRKRVVIQTDGHYDKEAALAWCTEVEAVLKRAGASDVKVGKLGAEIVFDGDADISAATSPEDWLRAMSDLLRPVGERERIMAEFTAEAWIRDYAVPVDADGETEIDVTYEMLLIGREAATTLTTGDTDYLKEAVRTTPWVAGWSGPYTIQVADAAEDSTLFD